MKYTILFLLTVCLAAAALALTSFTPASQVGTDVLTRHFTLPPADGLDAEVFADVVVSEGATQKVEVSGPSHLLDQLRVRVQSGILEFRTSRSGINWLGKQQPSERLKISVTLPTFKLLKLAGAGSITGLTPLTSSELEVTFAGASHATLDLRNARVRVAISGAGDVLLRGTTTRQEVRIQGTGNYHAFDLQSVDAVASVSGTGSQEISVSNSLKASIAGIGTIRYRGKPATITRSVSGLGTIEESN